VGDERGERRERLLGEDVWDDAEEAVRSIVVEHASRAAARSLAIQRWLFAQAWTLEMINPSTGRVLVRRHLCVDGLSVSSGPLADIALYEPEVTFEPHDLLASAMPRAAVRRLTLGLRRDVCMLGGPVDIDMRYAEESVVHATTDDEELWVGMASRRILARRAVAQPLSARRMLSKAS
jgi:hypothetical protein